MTNNLVKFIRDNPDWESKLVDLPYCLIIKTDSDYPNLYLFKYNQYASDMNNIICQEARGIILEITNDIKVVCHSFDKFFNYSEEQGKQTLDHFNWGNYSFQEKRDGSLMRLWFYNNKWHISTSGTIDAYKATTEIPGCCYHSFGEMFSETFKKYNENLSDLNPHYTYSFELTSPNNKIVVDYKRDELTLIGIRDLDTGRELNPYKNNPFKHISNPIAWKYKDTEQALEEINKKNNFEGLVLCDDQFNRVKIKTDEYLLLAKMVESVNTDKGILRLILEDRIDDIEANLPQLHYRIERVRKYIRSKAEEILAYCQSIDYSKDRKVLALEIKDHPYSQFAFRKLGNAHYDPISDYFKLENINKIYRDYKERCQIEEEEGQ